MKGKYNWISKPITWGSYLKFAGICSAISMAIAAVEIVWIWWDEITDWLDRKLSRVKAFFKR